MKRSVNRPTIQQPSDLLIRLIPLTKGQVAIVDANDYENLCQWNWYTELIDGKFYAKRDEWNSGKRKRIFMHRQILDVTQGDVDHRNGDGLDNRRLNLRSCTRAENVRNQRMKSANTSGFKGVTFDSARSKWVAQIVFNYKHIFLGRFDSPEEAHSAYCEASAKYHGEFGRTK